MRVDGKRVLVTGGAKGIGRAIAERLAAAGGNVVIADLAVDEARTVAAAMPGTHHALHADVADEASVAAMVAETVRLTGGLDVLVHAAGLAKPADILDLSADEFRQIISINLTGTFLACRDAARVMAAQGGGSLITIASSAAGRPSVRSSAYSASKGGVVTFTRAIAIDLAPRGIRANTIAPGPVETELARNMHTPQVRRAFTSRIPMERYGRPDEVAGAALYLASDESSFVTGAVLAVDGGYSFAGVTVNPL